MKIILKETVQNLGTVGDVVTVKDGYGRNYLLPRGLAAIADSKQVQVIEHHKRALESKRRRELVKSEDLAKELNLLELTFTRKTSDQDHMFGSVTTTDIEAAILAKGYTVTRRQIVVEQPIKSLGEYAVSIRLPGSVKARVKVTVTQEAEAH
jgi:large subunit ribosomal protein L9